VVSNDSDIAEAMRLVREQHGKRIGLVTPGTGRPSQQLEQHADFVRHIRANGLRYSQLPDLSQDLIDSSERLTVRERLICSAMVSLYALGFVKFQRFVHCHSSLSPSRDCAVIWVGRALDRDLEDQLGQAAIVANLRHLDYVCLVPVSGLDGASDGHVTIKIYCSHIILTGTSRKIPKHG